MARMNTPTLSQQNAINADHVRRYAEIEAMRDASFNPHSDVRSAPYTDPCYEPAKGFHELSRCYRPLPSQDSLNDEMRAIDTLAVTAWFVFGAVASYVVLAFAFGGTP